MVKKAFFVTLFIALSLYGLFWPGAGPRVVEVDVPAGASAHMVADRLVDQGVLMWRFPFLFWARLFGADNRLQVGLFREPQGRAAYWLLRDLVSGRAEKARLVIPEGFASWQIAERLNALEICSGQDFINFVAAEHLEGFLFPAIYELPLHCSVRQVAGVLKHQFDLHWTMEMNIRAAELGWTKANVVTLASILEREVRVRDELPLISAVYHNRLKKHMRLEADPTVQYAEGFWNKRLTYDDYRKTNSPYNTYLHAGLPPGPICSPGVDALRAALWPAASSALFILAQEDGRHAFSTTYREHTNKVNKRNRTRKFDKKGP